MNAEQLIREAEAKLARALRAFEADVELDVAFGAPSAQERQEVEAERAEVAQLEAQALATQGPRERRRNPMWGWHKRTK